MSYASNSGCYRHEEHLEAQAAYEQLTAALAED